MSANLLEHSESEHTIAPIRAKAFVFADEKSQLLFKQLEQVAPTEAPVLIVGETGTGKELVARHIHKQSRRTGPFVAVNCGALSQTLAEAELFGHQAGSYTGANETRAGWFETANNGTLFLDEIGELPLALQVKLLRVLQEREVVRVGARKAIPLNVRVIAATNVDLAKAVADGNFRQDLYYRLNVLTFELPPLRERRGDIPPLVEHFARVHAMRLHMSVPVFAPTAIESLLGHAWPGNIRELENVVQAALIAARASGSREVERTHLRFAAAPRSSASTPEQNPLDAIRTELDRLFLSPPHDLYLQVEELFFKRAFNFCAGNQVHTAKLLGISRNILRTQLKHFGLIGS